MTQPTLDGLALGELLAEQGIARVLTAPTQEAWREEAYLWLGTRNPGEHVTSTDLVEAIGMPPSPNAVGAVMRSAATLGLLAPTDVYVKSRRPSCHAAVVRVWQTTGLGPE
jgi:hypothetical protein